MAYEFDDELICDELFTDALSSEIAEFTLGFDLSENFAVLMSIMLLPIDEAYDLRFGIRQKDLASDWRVTPPDYSREAVGLYIPKEKRANVLARLTSSITELVSKKMPDLITMETYYPDLPDFASHKYKDICGAVHCCGYETTDNFRHGTTKKDHWFFTKVI